MGTYLLPPTKRRTLFFDSPFGGIFLVLLIVFISVMVSLALRVDIDYFDSHNMLLQARRLTDEAYAFVGFDSHRPRTLVALLTFFNLGFTRFSEAYPSIHTYHLFMGALTTAFIFVWFAILSKLFGRGVAYAASIFLISEQLLAHYSIFLLTNITAGLFWGLLFWFFPYVLDALEYSPSPVKQRFLAGGLGIFGALAALSKNHLALILPSLFFLQSGLYFLFPNLRPKTWNSLKAFRRWAGFSLLINFILIDLGTRVFGRWGEGVPEHYRKIFKEAFRQTTERTPADLYLSNLIEILGPFFCLLSLVSLFIMVTTVRHHLPQNEAKRTGIFCLLLMTLLYTSLTQTIAHREVRYLLPLLPAIFGFIAWGASIIALPFGNKGRVFWSLLWGFALLHPLGRTYKDLKVFFNDPIYQETTSNSKGFREYLKVASPSGEHCKLVVACPFALLPKTPFELKNDPYYRRYDMEPQFSYHVASPTKTVGCPPMEPNIQSRLLKMAPSIDQGTCYVLTDPIFPTVPAITVIKSQGTALSEHEASRYQKTVSLESQESLHCEGSTTETQFCYVRKEFFGF